MIQRVHLGEKDLFLMVQLIEIVWMMTMKSKMIMRSNLLMMVGSVLFSDFKLLLTLFKFDYSSYLKLIKNDY